MLLAALFLFLFFGCIGAETPSGPPAEDAVPLEELEEELPSFEDDLLPPEDIGLEDDPSLT
ncbi:MAG TPA: hypothetical protein VJH24_05730 [Candidatus Bilamarchaeaceae archaeon]|nr:hypothetical protein [Candidatus Bilamarchaeaceae archaeon]